MDIAVKTPASPSVQHRQEGQRYQLENSGSCECNTGKCIFKWPVPNIQQKKTAPANVLYSRPFYTDQNGGYKLCLFLYMDGDGSGKGTHLSFFLTLMKGEYDALLSWPFVQNVTLMLVDQRQRQQHIAKWFQPDPELFDSYQKPSVHSEMNVAVGYPKFAPVSILENTSYVKDDTMIFQCLIDATRI